MEVLFNKYFWVIKGLGLAVVAGLAASAVMTQLGTQFALDIAEVDEESEQDSDGEDEDEDDKEFKFPDSSVRGTSSRFGRSNSPSVSKQKAAADIKKRNIFCPTCVPEDAVPPTAAPIDVDGRPVGIQPGEVKSKLPLKLMATMESDDPEYSLATVYDAENQITGLYGLRDPIRPNVLVVGVDSGILHIRNNAALEYLQLGEQTIAPPPTTREKKDDKKKDEKKPNSREIDGADDAINCPNENLCTVDRSFVEKLMSNPAMLAKQARIVPSQKDGETQGFKFYGIRRGSLPKLLGLKNGDMLTEVNGEEIRSVDQAMALAMKLRRASNLSVTLVRKGKPLSKEIQIQ